MIKKAIKLKGVDEVEIISKLERGKFFIDKRAGSVIIGDGYIFSYARFQYFILSFREISKVTYDPNSWVGGEIGNLVWVTKVGKLYSTLMTREVAYTVIAFYDQVSNL